MVYRLRPEQKKVIVEFAEQNLSYSQQKLANHFSQVWNIPVSRRTVGDILASASNFKHGTKPKNPLLSQLEMRLKSWFVEMKSQHVDIPDNKLRQQAKFLARTLGISNLAFIDGWLFQFKNVYVTQWAEMAAQF